MSSKAIRMASTYGKRACIHQLVALTSFLLLMIAYLMLFDKQENCETPLLSREHLTNWTGPPVRGISKQALMTELTVDNLRVRNKNELASRLVWFVQHYYDTLILCHYCLLVWCLFLIIFGCVNIVPKHDDLKMAAILLLILCMGFVALFAFGTAFVAFNQPCKDYVPLTARSRNTTDEYGRIVQHANTAHIRRRLNWVNILQRQWSLRQIQYYQLFHNDPDLLTALLNNYNNNSQTFLTTSTSKSATVTKSTTSTADKQYSLRFRAIKDKRPVNAYEDDDDVLAQVTLIDVTVGFILLCSTFLFFFDSRQHMIEWRN